MFFSYGIGWPLTVIDLGIGMRDDGMWFKLHVCNYNIWGLLTIFEIHK